MVLKVGENIKCLRVEKAVTQEQLGRVEAQRLTISLWQVFGTAPSEPDGHLSMYPALRLLLNR